MGHRHPEILAALEKALGIGTSFGAPTEQEIDLADAICDAVPSIEMVIYTAVGGRMSMRPKPADVVDQHIQPRVGVEYSDGQPAHLGLGAHVGGKCVDGRAP